MSLASIAVAYIDKPTIHHGRLRLARNQSALVFVSRPQKSANKMIDPLSRTTTSQSIRCMLPEVLFPCSAAETSYIMP